MVSLALSQVFCHKLFTFCNQVGRYKLQFSVCCSTKTKYWIPVLETYWSIITSMVFHNILVQYQCSIEVLNYFSVSLSVFQKKIRGQKFEYFIVLKKNSLREVHNYQLFSCQLSNFLPEMPNLFWIAFKTKI